MKTDWISWIRWIRRLVMFLGLCAGAQLAVAADFPRAAVPEPLKTWIPWVLDDVPDAGCPHPFDDAGPRQCAWPGVLELKAGRHGGVFSQDWQVYRESWVGLPGDARNWPQEVLVDGKPATVIGREGVPSVRLAAGRHRLDGRFAWRDMPESLALPEGAALLQLDLDGKPVTAPFRDEENRLWLQGRTNADGDEAGASDETQMRVYRKIIDGIPVMVETQIRLEVSGKARELVVDRALLPGSIAKQIDSPLPAMLTQDGGLKVQARAGTWDLTLFARYPGEVKELQLAPAGAPATDAQDAGNAGDGENREAHGNADGDDPATREEVWVYQAAPSIRSATIEGVSPVDPQQTTLPAAWRRLPGYLVRPGDVFVFKEIRRGDSDPSPGQLRLERRAWLSFDGSVLTLSDRLQGEIGRAGRLEMGAPATLGRVDIDGQDQLITRGADGLAGIEVKRGRLALGADSEVDGAPRRFAAVGWNHDVEHLNIELNLPAGWRLLHAAGADEASGAWLMQWSLLDFFLIMLSMLAAGRLWGVRWSLVVLPAMILAYQEPGAPTWEWLLLLAVVAVHRVLPAGRAKTAMNFVRRAGILLLALCMLAFATDQIRTAIYPVLERDGAAVRFDGWPHDAAEQGPLQDAMESAEVPVELSAPAPASAPQAEVERKVLSKSVRARDASPAVKQAAKQHAYRRLDPDAKVQTGPGLPDWHWRRHRLSWNGPVDGTQTLDLWLLPPLANKLVVLLRLALLVLFLVRIADLAGPADCAGGGGNRPFGRWFGRDKAGRDGDGPTHVGSNAGHGMADAGRAAGGCLALGLLLAMLAGPGAVAPAGAALPTEQQLKALRSKLTRPAECLPECADISRLSVQIVGNGLRLVLDVEAAGDVALPLPGGARHWLPGEARLDGAPAYIRRGDADGGDAWLLVPAGRHRIDLSGALTTRDRVQLPLPLKPRRVDVQAEGWEVAGLSEESGVADILQLSRSGGQDVRSDDERRDEAPALPPFLRVERRLVLDLLWRVETTVYRDSPAGVPVVVQIPLLPGEAVTTSGIVVQDGKALVNLGPQSDSLHWVSTLAQREDLALRAPETDAWVESWSVVASALWHVDAQGIPPIAAAESEEALAFRPWPGETLQLAITRPQPVPGQTLTIDRSNLTVTAGARASDYHLNFALRSSRGADHVVTLPEGAVLQRVAIDGETRPIRPDGDGRRLTLPVTPGKQTVDIVWRADQEMAMNYATQRVDLGQDSVNHRIQLKLPYDRWLLMAGGPGIGPAILFWGKLLVLIAVAIAIGRFSARQAAWPMRKPWQWLLLALGLTQAAWWAAAFVVAWFAAFAWRERQRGTAPAGIAAPAAAGGRFASLSHWPFNLGQILLVLLTLLMLGVLFGAVESGLLGYPDMQVMGNDSSGFRLNWYLDRAGATPPGVWTLSLPILVYRGLMLLWALWLAWSLLDWLKWGWNAFSAGGLWRRQRKIQE